MLIFSLLLLALCSLGIAGLNHACALGKIKRNPFVGIRTAKTMVNEETWQAGHGAAVQSMWVSGIAAAAISLAGLLFLDSPNTQIIMALLACALLLTAVIYGSKLANIAAVETITVEKKSR
ncbi:SdpI family protein [Arthrobacter antibioticus]|uniref:SdpI family protein n=1 Tax=Arthrobacter sp. H35-MC1 TaxID=3046203 RepID=UPI0024B9DCC5|nr:SdpI family protein [Arthrobacter sp. H35-MC1]MDJ0316342.1 SdpI family protein [Arthrobacter sp. H35-MC1]